MALLSCVALLACATEEAAEVDAPAASDEAEDKNPPTEQRETQKKHPGFRVIQVSVPEECGGRPGMRQSIPGDMLSMHYTGIAMVSKSP